MKRPKIVDIKINWIDPEGMEHNLSFSEVSIEEAHELLSLMIGEITEEDLKP